MKGLLIKFHIVSFFVISFSFAVAAQNFRYIYMQTEDQTPFYVKMGDQTMSSASSGYIIIPKLTEGSYKIIVGFPKTTMPELSFTVLLNEKDAGYILKNDAVQGLFIIDIQTNKFYPSEVQLTTVKTKAVTKSKDEFARILAEVVNDSTINQIELFKKPEPTITKAEVVQPTENPMPAKPVVASNINTDVVIEAKTGIVKLDQKSTDEGFSFKYVDGIDTVDVFLPITKISEPQVPLQISIDTTVLSKKDTEPVKDVKFINMELQNPNQKQDSGVAIKDDFVITQKKEAITSINNKCKNTATQKDFLDLRKKMAAQKTEAAMQRVVLTAFNNTCFITEHIKNLGALFITEEERYKFYVAAYSHVSDIENFATLQSQLTNDYYMNRFKAMLTH